MQGLGEKGLDSMAVLAGGIIPEEDIPALEKMGIKAVFGPGTKTSEIAETIKKLAAGK
jgi:methylmalonyl-CoA mutase C-terminal domain/subunit